MTELGFARVGPSDSAARNIHGRFVFDDNGAKLCHDLVYERSPAGGVWSTEVRCANAHKVEGLTAARRNQRNSAESFWKTFRDAGAHRQWLGRILLLVWLKDDRVNFDVRGDVYTDVAGWRPLFGWPGASASLSSSPTSSPAVSASSSSSRSQNRQQQTHEKNAKRKWSDVSGKFFPDDDGGHKLSALAPKTKVARVTLVLQEARAERNHIGEKLPSLFGDRRKGFHEGRGWGKGPSSANGGVRSWVANERCCEKIWAICSK